ncbi:type II secretion system F family protein [Hydrogenophaga taeniospiralis]|uniref:type II secretion system F family protein n=1 Tax=Hydrogenophaga taeniospiralis TaxID=65656 RepID=UPI001CFACD54|nr:type II secretion system F family protein [Hydrogenophaga taeniospiralis]MCB4363303.1 type II secretion system F family protein [Hydrogenophaga taeniospiralis]
MHGNRYQVRALDSGQRIISLEIDAIDEIDARQQAVARQLTPLSLRPVSAAFKGLGNRPAHSELNLLLFVQELHALIGAGLGIAEALEILLERAHRPQGQRVLQRLLSHLQEGQRLSQAMQHQAGVFPALLVGIVQSAEDTSDLPKALQRYIHYETQLQGLRYKIIGAAIYPIILSVVGAAVALFLLGYVVPKFSSVYQGSGRDLPWASMWLLHAGEWIAAHQAMALVLVGTVLTLGAMHIARLRRSGQWWQALSMLPGAAPRLEILELSRLYLTLSMLLEGGIPIGRTMQLASAVLTPKRHVAWDAVRQQVTEGTPLTTALESNGLSTVVAARLLRVGERSGQMATMLGKAAAFHEAETARWIDRFTKAFEPILMAIIGVVIGLIVILLYIPVFDLAGSLQ